MYCGDGGITVSDQPATKCQYVTSTSVMLKWNEGDLQRMRRTPYSVLGSFLGEQVTRKPELTISSSPTKIKQKDGLGMRDHRHSFPIQIMCYLRNTDQREALEVIQANLLLSTGQL